MKELKANIEQVRQKYDKQLGTIKVLEERLEHDRHEYEQKLNESKRIHKEQLDTIKDLEKQLENRQHRYNIEQVLQRYNKRLMSAVENFSNVLMPNLHLLISFLPTII